MIITKKCFCLASIVFAMTLCAQAQKEDSLIEKVVQFPNDFFNKITRKTNSLDEQLNKDTEKYLEKLAKRERKLRGKLEKKDSALAKSLFDGTQEKYNYFIQKMKNAETKAGSLSGEYLPYIDSLKGSLSFLQQNKKLLALNPELTDKLGGSINGFNQLQSRLEISNQVKEFINQRKQQLRQTFAKYTDALNAKKYLDDYNKQVYYYGEQVKAYKQMLNDPDQMEKKALSLLNKLPAFQSFMKQHSMLAGLLNMPANGGGMGGQAAISQGMPTRDQVLSMAQDQTALAGPNMSSVLQKGVESAQGQIDQLRNKLNAYGSGGDIDMPDFKPNNQKSKTFFERLEYGSNLQTAHGTYYFPTTTDLGLSVGYKLNNKSTIGIGASYKIGWGSDINHVNVSSQGVGIRSFLDMQLKKTFYASGGFEYNYQEPFTSLYTIRNLSSWQQSGLIGISKIISLRTKVLKNSKVQFLWDFLSYQQIPQTQPFKFRIGYSF